MTRREAVQELSPWPEPSRWHGLHSFLGSCGSSPHSSSLAEGALRTRGGLGKLGFILPPPLLGPYSQAVFLTTLPRILSPSPTPVQLLPETPLPPHPFPHLPFLGFVFPLLSVPSQASLFLPSPCSIACVLPPASSLPLPFRNPGN